MKTLLLLLLVASPAFALEEEESEALRALRLSCEKQKVALGCFNYANMLIRESKPEISEKYFELGCKLHHQPSCAKERWEIPERQASAPQVLSAAEQAASSPAPASIPEEPLPEASDLSLDTGADSIQ